MNWYTQTGLSIPRATKPKVFVSYHHANDQRHADRFTALFHDTYDAVTDRSLDAEIDSDNDNYIYQKIREEFISGTSCTIVLCGRETMKRKHVDWEIKATLDKGHGLLGIALPSCPKNILGHWLAPDRLTANVNSGYACWLPWTEDATTMRAAIDLARTMSAQTAKIQNSTPMMSRNQP